MGAKTRDAVPHFGQQQQQRHVSILPSLFTISSKAEVVGRAEGHWEGGGGAAAGGGLPGGEGKLKRGSLQKAMRQTHDDRLVAGAKIVPSPVPPPVSGNIY